MSLAASLQKFKSEMSESAARNASSARPSGPVPARTSTPQPGNKRPRDSPATTSAVPPASSGGKNGTSAGAEIMTHMVYAVQYLKERFPVAATLPDILNFLSLPADLQKHTPLIRRALVGHDRIAIVPKHESQNGKESFRYNPQHPVTNADEMKNYLASLPTAAGIPVRELKDGWPTCIPELETLASKHEVLLLRQKKDNAPKTVYPDSSTFYVHMDEDFVDFWSKCKLPASEAELRTELEKANLTPTSQVKEIKKGNMHKKEKKRVNRRGGKTTNLHMMGILRDYKK
jgi:transcription initiation factor TFIIE subunit beta